MITAALLTAWYMRFYQREDIEFFDAAVVGILIYLVN